MCEFRQRTNLQERNKKMELKTIIASVLAVFVIGGFIFLQVRSRKK